MAVLLALTMMFGWDNTVLEFFSFSPIKPFLKIPFADVFLKA